MCGRGLKKNDHKLFKMIYQLKLNATNNYLAGRSDKRYTSKTYPERYWPK